MLSFYLDSQLTIPASASTPKKFLVPLKGGAKSTTVYLGDGYQTVLTAAAPAGATVLDVDDVSEFLPAGHATVGTQTVSYTSVSNGQLNGVVGLTNPATLGTVVRPKKNWITPTGGAFFFIRGGDRDSIGVSLSLTDSTGLTFPGMPLLLPSTYLALGASLPILIQVNAPAGSQAEYSDLTIATSGFYAKDSADTGSISGGDVSYSAELPLYLFRRDQSLPLLTRVLPASRQVKDAMPGFVWGQYRWRDKGEINQAQIVPSKWNIDPEGVGVEKFIAGIGSKDDLKPLGFVQDNNSIYLEVERGHYFTGPNRYFLPAAPQLDILSSAAVTLQLTQTPAQTYPMYVGTYRLDSQGYYEKDTEYRYQTAAAVTRGDNLPEFFYTIDRKTKQITLNSPMVTQDLYLGTLSGDPVDYFDVPIYPVDQVLQVFVMAVAGGAPTVAPNWSFDQDLGTITVSSPSGTGISIPGGFTGMAVFATCTPAVAALYETDPNAESLIVKQADLNPAFAGLSSGYVYLEHRRQKASYLTLSCDKPRIAVPATLASIVDLVAYGPVYLNGDYSLLQAKAFSGVDGEIIPNISLKVVVDEDTFSGRINYLDPLTEDVQVVTGGDGIANLIYTPEKDFGFYIPDQPATPSLAGLTTTNIANDTLVLPEVVPISQIWNATDGWLVTTYTVLNTNPLLGKANAGSGEVPFTTSGTPGTTSYRTNGMRVVLGTDQAPRRPVEALDVQGNAHTSSQFDGNVHSLVFSTSVPSTSSIPSYLVVFLQRVVIRLQEVGTNVTSNSIMLEIALSPLINDNVWLTLDDSVNGILNQFRLGIS